MSLLGGIGLMAAIANYRKAKAEYLAAKNDANDAAVLAAIKQYNNSKYNMLDEYDKKIYDPNATFENLLPIPIVNAGMLVGDKCRIKPQCVLQNVGDQAVKIYKFGIVIYLLGEPFVFANKDIRFTISPKTNVTITFPLPTTDGLKETWVYNNLLLGKAFTESLFDLWSITDQIAEIRDFLISRYGQTYTTHQWLNSILSVPDDTFITGNIRGKDIVSADVEIMYATEDNHDVRRAVYRGCKGSFVYKGEAYYPGGGKWIIE